MKEGRATFVKKLKGWSGDARLYRVDPGINFTGFDENGIGTKMVTQHVVVSAIEPLVGLLETYIFATNNNGEVISWTELPGSFRGDTDHERALQGAGYNVAP